MIPYIAHNRLELQKLKLAERFFVRPLAITIRKFEFLRLQLFLCASILAVTAVKFYEGSSYFSLKMQRYTAFLCFYKTNSALPGSILPTHCDTSILPAHCDTSILPAHYDSIVLHSLNAYHIIFRRSQALGLVNKVMLRPLMMRHYNMRQLSRERLQ